METGDIQKELEKKELKLIKEEIWQLSDQIGQMMDHCLKIKAVEAPRDLIAKVMLLTSNWASLKERKEKLLSSLS